ncbi:MAG: hypothetical protein IKF38_05120 [Clostridia bacterium]|nr:hypothetical protein [Clostridia bacterium]
MRKSMSKDRNLAVNHGENRKGKYFLNMTKLKNSNSKGITLIALVITVIVLLILAGVSISAITGNESAMEKAKQAKTANENADELDSIKLAVVDAVAHGNDGYVTLNTLNNALSGLGLTATEGTDENSKTVFKVTGKTGIQYEINLNGNVTVKSGITLNSTTITLSDEKTSETITATLSADLSGTIEWSLADGTVNGSTSSNSVVSITPLSGNSITVTKVGDSGSATITAKLNGTQYPVTCTVKIQGPSVETYKERAIANGVTALNPNDNTTIQDSYGNNVIIPAGFGIATDSGESVAEGIVIQDVSAGKAGSQFVWVPVGTFKTGENSTQTVNLTRYDWIDTKGPVSGDTVVKGGLTSTTAYYSETVSNTVARKTSDNSKIEAIEQATAKGGFYIGRYEAGKVGSTAVCKASESVYNNITRDNAKTQAQGMYPSTDGVKFKSDLVNSYAWDTTIDFIQKCGTNTVNTSANYAYQVGYSAINTSSPQATGTNKLLYNGNDTVNAIAEANRTFDKQCNIFDMAGNVMEWTTEYSSGSGIPCVNRGGYYNSTSSFAALRYCHGTSDSGSHVGFRSLLYIM